MTELPPGPVVLACGGFEYDEELRDTYLPLPLTAVGHPGNTGDGLRLAQAAGASLWHMSAFFGWFAFRHPDHVAAFPLDVHAPSFIYVDADGRRFADETGWEVHDKLRCLTAYLPRRRNHPHLPGHLIFDEKARLAGPLNGIVGTPNDYAWSADNSAELAAGWIQPVEALDLPELEQTLREYGAVPDEFGRDPGTIVPLEPPLYAIEMHPASPPRRAGRAATLARACCAPTARRFRASTRPALRLDLGPPHRARRWADRRDRVRPHRRGAGRHRLLRELGHASAKCVQLPPLDAGGVRPEETPDACPAQRRRPARHLRRRDRRRRLRPRGRGGHCRRPDRPQRRRQDLHDRRADRLPRAVERHRHLRRRGHHAPAPAPARAPRARAHVAERRAVRRPHGGGEPARRQPAHGRAQGAARPAAADRRGAARRRRLGARTVRPDRRRRPPPDRALPRPPQARRRRPRARPAPAPGADGRARRRPRHRRERRARAAPARAPRRGRHRPARRPRHGPRAQRLRRGRGARFRPRHRPRHARADPQRRGGHRRLPRHQREEANA